MTQDKGISEASAFDLTGKSVVVTGASPGGLGIVAARQLLKAGARAVISDLPSLEGLLQESVAHLQRHGEVRSCPADVTSESDIAHLVDAAEDALGPIDALVHTAGVMMRAPSLETSRADFERVVATNLTATWLVNRAFAERMLARGQGAIVNTTSVYASMVGPLPEPAYYASKAGVSNLTRGLASEWGPGGVRVNCVAPGVFFPTRMTAPLADDPGQLDSMTAKTMLGRLGDPDRDIGDVYVWLASEASRYVTAQTVYVDGGWSAW